MTRSSCDFIVCSSRSFILRAGGKRSNQLRWRLSSCQAEDTDLITSSLAGLGPAETAAGSRRSALLVTADPHRPTPPPPRGLSCTGQMSPGRQLAHLWAPSVTTYLLKGSERDKVKGLLVLVDDFDFFLRIHSFSNILYFNTKTGFSITVLN